MTDPNATPNADDGPPLVTRVEEPPPLVLPVLPPAPRPPRPGIVGAVVWCILFLIVLQGSTIVAGAGAWALEGLRSGDTQKFFKDEIDKLLGAATASQHGEPMNFPPGLSNAIVWGMIVGQPIGFLFVWVLTRRVVGQDWPRQFALRRPPLVVLVLALLATPGFMILHGGFHELIRAAFNQHQSDTSNQSLKSIFEGWSPLIAFFVVGICPGVLEEFFCRGFLARGLVGRYGYVAGVVITSILFGVLHVLPLYALGVVFMGIVLHYTYIVSRSLWVPVLIHTFNNGVTILATIGIIDMSALKQDATLGPAGYAAAAAAVLFAVVGMWVSRVKLFPADPAEPMWEPAYPGVELPPPGANAIPVAGRMPPVLLAGTLLSTAALIYFIAR